MPCRLSAVTPGKIIAFLGEAKKATSHEKASALVWVCETERRRQGDENVEKEKT